MKPPIAYCHDGYCEAEIVHDNAPSTVGPRPIYGPRGMAEHKGHDVREVK